jgi:hypothetical protein
MIDGKPLDLTKPGSFKGITIKPGGHISQTQNGVTTAYINHHSWCDSKKNQPCNCKGK